MTRILRNFVLCLKLVIRMNDIIKLILSLSLSGSILAIAIFAMKPLLKHRLSKRVQYGIWIVVILRLIIPLSFEDSIMNKVFYSNSPQLEVNIDKNANTDKDTVLPVIEGQKVSSSTPINDVKQSTINSEYKHDTKGNISFIELLNQYAIYLWLLGLIITLMFNLIGYLRFLRHLKPNNIPAANHEQRMLEILLQGKYSVTLVKNSSITTPMLIGIRKPYILVPDAQYEEEQLKNILLHELMHFKRRDIGIKWLTLFATAAHWFNPLMYFIRSEINYACELACDEAVIKDMSKSGKQAYGDTLISVVAENRYPKVGLKATMYEEKKSLRERLIAIMDHTKKSKPIIALSIILLGTAITASIALGASVKTNNDKPPKMYITAEEANAHIYFSIGNIKAKVGLTGSYEWKYLGRSIKVNSPSPINFKYNDDNIVSATTKQQIVISTQKLNSDKKYAFSIDKIIVYKAGKRVPFKALKPNFVDGKLCLQLPKEDGEYIYALKLNFKDKGTVNYGFVVRVNMMNLSEIVKYKTKYIGNNSKVGALSGLLPTPNKYFLQRYISMQTSKRPYKLNVYYETNPDIPYLGEWPISNTNSKGSFYMNLQKNALVLFSMIDNLEVLSFSFRNSSSGRNSNLEMSKYVTAATFQRSDFEKKYGDLKALGGNLNLLQEALK